MKSMAESFIREYVKKGLLDYSHHAQTRMVERCIEREQVVDCILHGKVVELQKHFDDVHVLFQEASVSKPETYVVIAATCPPLVVTVCKTRDEVWEFCNGYLKRRKRND